MSQDYGEILCTAVDTIVQSRLNGLAYDISKEATITKIVDKDRDIYNIVLEGGLNRENVYSIDKTKYAVGDSVLVTIPNGDYNKAVIMSKMTHGETDSVSFKRPLDTIIKGTGNIAWRAGTSSSAELIANKNSVPNVNMISLLEKRYLGFTKIGIAANFATMFDSEVIDGDYGLLFSLIKKNVKPIARYYTGTAEPSSSGENNDTRTCYEVDLKDLSPDLTWRNVLKTGAIFDITFPNGKTNDEWVWLKIRASKDESEQGEFSDWIAISETQSASSTVKWGAGNIVRLAFDPNTTVSYDNGLYRGVFNVKDDNVVDSVTELKFSCKDMFGNPYKFLGGFRQEYVFDIPSQFTQIDEMYVSFYQDNNFKDGNDNALPVATRPNLFVKDLEIYLGYDAEQAIEESVMIASDNLYFIGLDDEVKTTYLQWIHKIDESTLSYITLNDIKKEDSPYEVRWYRYEQGCEDKFTDEYGGANWRYLKEDEDIVQDMKQQYPMEMTFHPSNMRQTEQIKAVTIIETHPLINDTNYSVYLNYTSNILEFVNMDDETYGGDVNGDVTRSDFSLFFHDNTYGNYFIYDQNGELFDTTDSQKLRQVELMYKGSSINKDNSEIFNRIKAIKWEVPNTDDSMIDYNITSTGLNFQNENDDLTSHTKWSQESNDYFTSEPITHLISGSIFAFEGDITFNKDGTVNKVLVEAYAQQNNDWSLIYASPDYYDIPADGKIRVFDQFYYGTIDAKQVYSALRIKIKQVQTSSEESFRTVNQDNNAFNTTLKIKSATYTSVAEMNNENKIQSYFTYTIEPTLDFNKNNNTIKCTVILKDGNNEIECEPLIETLRFGKKGTNGSKSTFILEMLDSENAVVVNDLTRPYLRVQALLFDANGKRKYFTDGSAPTFTLLYANGYVTAEVSADDSSIVHLKPSQNLKNVPNSNYYGILKASYNYTSASGTNEAAVLETYLPIPIKSKISDYISGPTEVLYTHQGFPRYGATSPYVLFQSGVEKYQNWSYINWSEEGVDKDGKTITITNPNPISLKAKNSKKFLQVQPLYCTFEGQPKSPPDPVIQDRASVYYPGHWIQPILIMQSRYDFALLNSWDGSLTIDEKNGTILATMIGAGKKNTDDNTFSGVLMGDVRGGTQLNDTETLTGVYGLSHGIMTYGLKENGSAFFGAYANGRIEIDGTSGIIRSAGWIKDGSGNWILNPPAIDEDGNSNEGHNNEIVVRETGSLFDLDDGQLQMLGKDDTYFKFNADSDGTIKMRVKGTNIELVDKEGTPGLSGYIDATAAGITTEFRRTAAYYGVCETGDSLTQPTQVENNAVKTSAIRNDDNLTKILELSNFTEGFNNKTEDENTILKLTDKDILKEGVTIAVTFSNSETVDEYVIYSNSINAGDNEVLSDMDIHRSGAQLSLNLKYKVKKAPPENEDETSDEEFSDGNDALENEATTIENELVNDDEYEIKETGPRSIYLGGNPVGGDSNPFGWAKGTTVYFVYRGSYSSGHWEITDSGSYSNMISTADLFKNTISNMNNTLSTAITQTAKNIRLEAAKKASYVGICDTEDGTNPKVIDCDDLTDDKFYTITTDENGEEQRTFIGFTSGVIMSITFNKAQSTGTALTFKICENEYSVKGNPTWKAGETLPFVFDGTFWTMTSLSDAYIDVTANAIISQVKRTAGYACTGSVGSDGVLHAHLEITQDETGSRKLTLQDIMQPGVTLAVYIGSAAKNNDGSLVSIKTLLHEIDGITDEISPITIYRRGSPVNNGAEGDTITDNKLIYSIGDTIYFSYLDNKWLVVDSGAFSNITQTADAIRSEVASGLNYVGTCESDANATNKKIIYNSTNKNSLPDGALKEGVTIAVFFTKGIQKTGDLPCLSGATLNNVPVYCEVYHNKTTTLKQGLPPCAPGSMLSFIYKQSYWLVNDGGSYSQILQTADSIISQVNDSLGNYSTIEQTSKDISAAVTGKLGETGEHGSFGWSITTAGFDIYKIINGVSTSLFNVDTDGNATFAGDLTADTTNFKTLQAGSFTIGSTTYKSIISADTLKLAGQNSDASRAGQLIIKSNPGWVSDIYYDDLSLYAERLKGPDGAYGGYGNLGLPGRRWDTLYVGYCSAKSTSFNTCSCESYRDAKYDIQVYDINQAYEELKILPIYTYKYKDLKQHRGTLSLGTMIDYMPIEMMLTDEENDGKQFNIVNTVFWNIAATQYMQIKVEQMQETIEYLQDQIFKLKGEQI